MATHKEHVKSDGRKVIEKFLTERQIAMLQKRRKVWFQVDHVVVILKPKAKNQKLLNRAEYYKRKYKETMAKLK